VNDAYKATSEPKKEPDWQLLYRQVRNREDKYRDRAFTLLEAARSGHRLLWEMLNPLPDYRMRRALSEIERLLGHPWPAAAVRDRLEEAVLAATPLFEPSEEEAS
jgi:hypothetical protein